MSEMSDAARGQVARSAAEVYEAFFVPALFGQFAAPLCNAAGIAAGMQVLDVACGTGAAARAAAGLGAEVTGVDLNPGMLAEARKAAPQIDWREGAAEALPLADASVDAALCQFGLMFFADRLAGLKELRRVTRPGGHVALAVWDSPDASPGYARMIALLDRLFGPEAANAMRAPFCLGDKAALAALLAEAGLGAARIETIPGTARFASIEAWVHTDVRGWTLADLIDEAGYARLLAAAGQEFAEFAAPDGRVSFPAPAHFAVAKI